MSLHVPISEQQLQFRRHFNWLHAKTLRECVKVCCCDIICQSGGRRGTAHNSLQLQIINKYTIQSQSNDNNQIIIDSIDTPMLVKPSRKGELQ